MNSLYYLAFFLFGFLLGALVIRADVLPDRVRKIFLDRFIDRIIGIRPAYENELSREFVETFGEEIAKLYPIEHQVAVMQVIHGAGLDLDDDDDDDDDLEEWILPIPLSQLGSSKNRLIH